MLTWHFFLWPLRQIHPKTHGEEAKDSQRTGHCQTEFCGSPIVVEAGEEDNEEAVQGEEEHRDGGGGGQGAGEEAGPED